jgi:LPS sulfotransferase NodH
LAAVAVMGSEQRFVIFSLPRSGSTTLQRLLNCHPAVQCIGEPFHPTLGAYSRRVRDETTLASAVREIWERRNGIRHTWELSGWPFAEAPHLNDKLVSMPDQKILFLVRNNILRRVVSHHISAQTQIWSYFGDDDRERLRQFDFAPIDASWIEENLAQEKTALDRYRDILSQRGDFVEIAYEKFYDSALDDAGRVQGLANIIEYLGHAPISNPETQARIVDLFDARRTKLNSFETYRRIPEIEAVEARFGSAETGWLFRDS